MSENANDEQCKVQQNTAVLEDEEKADVKPYMIMVSTVPEEREQGRKSLTEQRCKDIDYNNYFVNAQKISCAAEDCEGHHCGAVMENYYSAEILNLKFNPNAKTRFGMSQCSELVCKPYIICICPNV